MLYYTAMKNVDNECAAIGLHLYIDCKYSPINS